MKPIAPDFAVGQTISEENGTFLKVLRIGKVASRVRSGGSYRVMSNFYLNGLAEKVTGIHRLLKMLD